MATDLVVLFLPRGDATFLQTTLNSVALDRRRRIDAYLASSKSARLLADKRTELSVVESLAGACRAALARGR